MRLFLSFLVRLMHFVPAVAGSTGIRARSFRPRAAGLVLLWLLACLPAAAWAQSPFEGTWQGTWRDQSNGQDGLVLFKVDRAGGVVGTVSNRQSGVAGPLQGRMDSAGTLTGSYSYREGRVVRVYQIVFVLAREGDRMAGAARFSFRGRVFGAAAVALQLDATTAREPAAEPVRPRPAEPGIIGGKDLNN